MISGKKQVEGRASILVLLDFSAAFNNIDYSILLVQMQDLGLGGRVLRWFG